MPLRSLLPLAFLLCAALQSKAQSLAPAVLRQVEDAEKAMFEATAQGDAAAFRQLSGVDYFTINADGSSNGLEQALAAVPRFKGAVTRLSEQTQRVFGNVVLRNGRAKIYLQDQQVAEILYPSGWVYRDGRWQFIHWQGTLTGMSLEGKGLIAPPAGPAPVQPSGARANGRR